MSHISQNMLLTVWDSDSDDFNLIDLENNWDDIDIHDHSSGKGVQISTAGIAPNAITTGLIAAGAVQNANLAPNSVATSNIQAAAITNALLAAGSVTGSVIAAGAITASMLDSTLIPLGQVALWWRPSGSSATPGGFWEIMDGRPWSGITNAFGLSTGNIPDMRGVFVQGADITGVNAPGIGVSGGSNTVNLAHSHNVNAHYHTVPSHLHGISSDGLHLHYWQGGLHMASRMNAFTPSGVTFQSQNGKWYTNTFYSMYIANLLSNPFWSGQSNNSNYQTTDANADMDEAGLHSHGGATAGSGTLTTNTATATTDSQLGSTNIEPLNTALLFIMRCR